MTLGVLNMSEGIEGKKRCVEALANKIVNELGLTASRYEWGSEKENFEWPVRIMTDQGITEPAIRVERNELEWCSDHSSEPYKRLKRKLTEALTSFSQQTRRLGFDPRKLMEMAAKVMRQSVLEVRKDGKTSPKVGTVIWKSPGVIETACRGELRYGDHAEYTLLERKNNSNRLDGSILFTTLEPCAPGSRGHSKTSCAERIIHARIKEVWVGIEDPDPTVDRKGIKYLQDEGIVVHMFDRDLQEVIQAENKEFLAQALERAAMAEGVKTKKITLSSLEGAFATAVTDDFSTHALEQYRSRAKIDDELSSSSFNRRLVHQGLLKPEDGRFTPTGFGLLLFGKEPRTVMPQAGLLATIHYPDDTEEPRNFDGPMVMIPGQLEKWLADKLPNVIDRSHMQRREVPPLPFEMVREAVVNALIHRDYDIRQAKCQLEITVDTITVKSPGGPLPPITLQQLQAFNAPMLSRNPELHYVFARMELAEERGLGIKSLRSRAEKLGLPLPRYRFQDPYLVLTLFRIQEAAARVLSKEVLDSLSKAEQKGWQWLSTKHTVASKEYATGMSVPNRTALNHLKRFTELGLLRRTGVGPSTRYEVLVP
jgi:ATP-dependent DNA helicase RecG